MYTILVVTCLRRIISYTMYVCNYILPHYISLSLSLSPYIYTHMNYMYIYMANINVNTAGGGKKTGLQVP